MGQANARGDKPVRVRQARYRQAMEKTITGTIINFFAKSFFLLGKRGRRWS